jgi:hypothetical protein
MLHSTELRCTLSELCCTLRVTLHLLSYTAPFWARLHPTWPTMLPKSYAATFWAMLYSSKLRWFLLSYSAFYWATPHPKWATRHPKNIMSPVYCSFSDLPTKLMIYRETLQNIPLWQTYPQKYTKAYLVQQSNCRWHCEPTFFFG